MYNYLRLFRCFSILIVMLSVSACKDNGLTPSNHNPQVHSPSSKQISTLASGKFITSDPAAFTKKLTTLNNENEVLIALKSSSSPRIAKTMLRELPTGGDDIIGLPKTSRNASRRTTPGFARVSSQSRQAIKGVLQTNNIAQLHAPDFAQVITAKLPQKETHKIVAALLKSPHVDYIEANRSYPVRFDRAPAFNSLYSLTSPFASNNIPSSLLADPQGNNPSDQKHTFHNVLDAWDYTRGSGARVGILDSGFSYDQGTNSYHPDGQLLSSTRGIEKLGFVDDYDDFGNCNGGGSGQPYGNCHEWDDNYEENGPDGHGTAMAGIVGANDNSQGYVGVMPDGLTISMKVAQNCRITKGCSNDSFTYRIESDGFYWAVIWARNNNIDVLSMSFGSTGISLSVYNALYDAYHQNDILLVAATGNDNPDYSYPRELSFVMGIGGLNNDGSSYGVNEDEEVSALAGGTTFSAVCVTNTSFCEPNGNQHFFPPFCGTSSATTSTAGIAGLVRAHNPSLSAPQVRQRLINTSVPDHHRVDAERAITNNIPLSVLINGPSYIGSSGNYSWKAMPQGGDAGYNYQWEYRSQGGSWNQVSTAKTYSTYIGTGAPDFSLQVTVTSGTEQDAAGQYVIVASEDCPPGQICVQ